MFRMDWNFNTTVRILEVLKNSGIDEQLVWKSGISIPEAPNHYINTYNQVRMDLLRLLIIVLS